MKRSIKRRAQMQSRLFHCESRSQPGPARSAQPFIHGERARNWVEVGVLLVIIAFVVMCLWIALRLAEPTKRLLGTTGINVVTRVLGLILLAVAVESLPRDLLSSSGSRSARFVITVAAAC